MNEAKILIYLRHPNIITLMAYHISESLDENILIFEYVSNGSLYENIHLKRTKFNKKNLLLQLSKTLNYMHSSGFCHRDLKSLNILINEHNNIKLIDFGLTKRISELNHGSGNYTSTPAYSAPEIYNQTELTEKVDIYAFGIIFWEVVMEEVPF